VVIPQIACRSVPLREVMLACGVLLLAVMRKLPRQQYDNQMALVLSHATRAIQGLTSKGRPRLIEIVLAAYLFWSLDVMSCRFQSAMMHGFSAIRIAKEYRAALANDELASTIVTGMIFSMPGPKTKPPPAFLHEPVNIRKGKAVKILEIEYDSVTACAERVALTCVPFRTEILAILQETRHEIEWILSKYNTPGQYANWLLFKNHQSPDAEQLSLRSAETSGLCQSLITDIDEYLAKAALDPDEVELSPQVDVPIDQWRQDFAHEVLMFVVLVAGLDLELRYINMDFFEVSRQIRWPGRCCV
jgi:hypothetical protein